MKKNRFKFEVFFLTLKIIINVNVCKLQGSLDFFQNSQKPGKRAPIRH